MKSKKPGFILSNYLKCLDFLNESKWHIVFAIGLFAIMFLIGFTFPVFFREEIFSFIAEMIEGLEGKSALDLIIFIFLNNMKASLMALILGVGLGIFPIIALVTNGYLLGFVSRYAVASDGIFVLWQLLPHGIFELPAVLFSIGIGIKIGMNVFAKNGGAKIKRDLIEGLRFFLFVIFPLLLIAAIIEGTLIGILN